MSEHAPGADNPILQAVRQAWNTPSLLADLAALYRQVDQRLAGEGSECLSCGKCCDFRNFGHKLYVSTAELALLAKHPPVELAAARQMRCPYQQAGRCLARDARTLGCRVFCCRRQSTEWENALYEEFHGQIQRIHQSHCTPYVYAELTGALLQLFISAEVI